MSVDNDGTADIEMAGSPLVGGGSIKSAKGSGVTAKGLSSAYDFGREMKARKSQIMSALTDMSSTSERGKAIHLAFRDIQFDIDGKRILRGITGEARPGRLLSIMGPSGSGKTTLLNTLSSRVRLSGGAVTLNGTRPVKAMKRFVAYVLQDEVFFGTMTVEQVLYFAARIRLPDAMPWSDKKRRADQVLSLLGIEKCRHSIVGTPFQRGISGGERKRLNIAVQLITWPSLILLDEPTSGLDSSTAYDLILTLRELTRRGCTVVTTIHQPPSQVFQLFDDLLLLAEGEAIYFGSAKGVLPCLERLHLQCPVGYSAGDFCLDIAKSGAALRVIRDSIKRDGRVPGAELKAAGAKDAAEPAESAEEEKKQEESKGDRAAVKTEDIETDFRPEQEWKDGWPTSWYTQFSALLGRAWLLRRSSAFDTITLLQLAAICAVTALLWFRMDFREESLEDRFGCAFFITVFWGFFPLLASVNTFPSERAVLLRERAQGSYRLSAYYLSKIAAELPFTVINPTLFVVVAYWATDLNPSIQAFFATWAILILNVETATAIGTLVSAAETDLKRAMVAATTLMLASMLFGGFYVNQDNIPDFLDWLQYLSFVKYAFGGIATQVFEESIEFDCATPSSYEACPAAKIKGTDVLEAKGIPNTPIVYAMVLLGIMLVCRIAGYFVLYARYKPKQH